MLIPLHSGGTWRTPGPIVAWTEVDPEDYENLTRYRWRMNDRGYAVRTSRPDAPTVCPECGWAPKSGHPARAMGIHRGKVHQATRPTRRTTHMARQILGLEYGDPRESDHINRNKLDNTRTNLRILDRADQQQNQDGNRGRRSKYRNVYRTSNGYSWQATVRGQYLGCFPTQEEARDAAVAWRRANMPYSAE